MNMLHSFSSGGASNAAGDVTSDSELKVRLIANVKKEVKQLMEEAVTKKYIHEESSSVTSLCGAVEACLSHGLRRRALGLFKTSSTTALIQKIAKICPEADYVSRRLLELELAHESHAVSNKRSSSSSDSIIKPKLLSKGSGSSGSVTTINTASSSSVIGGGNGNNVASPLGKYLWIRLALYEKRLAKIIEHLVSNAQSYYDREALVADPDYGSILSSLLVGPCALEFTRAKTADHYWSDPCADELVQRHRISSGNRTPPTCHRPIINFKRSLHTSSEDTSSGSFKACSPASVAKDYVESLHQNSRTTLLYGKNNVLVLPKDVSEPMPGYLSLHQSVQSLTIKWTPNQLMNGYNDTDGVDKSYYWSYALNINVDEIVYVHCHQNRGGDTGGTIILVGQDGVQRPPIHFPEGGHLQAFLSCLETGLLPHGQLDPPLWSQRGIGKLFPWPKSVRRHILPSVMESSSDETPIDYVFRVVSKSQHEEFLATHPILELGRSSPRRKHLGSCSTTGSSDCSSKSLSIDQSSNPDPPLIQASQTASIELVCSTMRRQIISRAFYGWLAYCRHLSTVRTHLSGLVNGRITPDLAADEEGLSRQKWNAMNVDGVVSSELELYRLVYFGGVEHEVRKEVWPYLLGHYAFGSTPEERQKQDETCKHYYETTMSEWLAVEAIVRQREKEKTALAVAKLSAEQARQAAKANSNSNPHELLLPNGSRPLNRVDVEEGEGEGEGENDVFDDNDFSDISDPGDEFDEQPGEKGQAQQKPEQTPDDAEGEDEAGEEEEEERPQLSEQVVLEFQNIDDMEPLRLQENCFADSEVEGDLGLALDGCGNILMLSIKSSPSTSSYETVGNEFTDLAFAKASEKSETEAEAEEGEEGVAEDEPCGQLSKFHSADDVRHDEEHPATAVIITEAASLDDLDIQCNDDEPTEEFTSRKTSLMSPLNEDITVVASLDALQEPKSACVSPASSNGGVYSVELLEQFGLNLHRIEKDVQRCDRNYWYFANENLDKLRNVISTYVWEHLDIGYMQGMCDLVAPLLVIFDDESLSYSCFCKLMERMIENFPSGGAMDMHFANMRSLIQILDSEMYDLMDSNGDYTHFYFCYRWFLLDFKRELIYDDVFATWEVIWAAKHIASGHFVLFLALALLETYRDIILSNSMDFTDVIKFFNEMAERHNAQSILQLSRSLVLQLQTIIENK
ncbi:small G protein signaling modulator 2 [Drosophila sulfurigaster albostrigata]|uniref:small G protein signaling modulator 2 n=1 Tax=Drosophila sulfurigaster albostrigata TaxID=89887 RepID=UPI002D21CADB|nr:small G protein signaling modulator 2 [Drosophila sulfurigaster albostrigata]XP_062138757.1 small G protein signaling modulator 2 [Drosophila sulfurigaster albostrigata]